MNDTERTVNYGKQNKVSTLRKNKGPDGLTGPQRKRLRKNENKEKGWPQFPGDFTEVQGLMAVDEFSGFTNTNPGELTQIVSAETAARVDEFLKHLETGVQRSRPERLETADEAE
jgi:hypothetical protein